MFFPTSIFIWRSNSKLCIWVFVEIYSFYFVDFIIISCYDYLVFKSIFYCTSHCFFSLIHLFDTYVLYDFQNCLKTDSQIFYIQIYHRDIFNINSHYLIEKSRPNLYIMLFQLKCQFRAVQSFTFFLGILYSFLRQSA